MWVDTLIDASIFQEWWSMSGGAPPARGSHYLMYEFGFV
jgi:hypothetical protein